MVTILISTRIIYYCFLAISIEFPIMDPVLKLCSHDFRSKSNYVLALVWLKIFSESYLVQFTCTICYHRYIMGTCIEELVTCF